MRFSLRALLVLVTLAAVECFLWTITPSLVRVPMMVAAILVLPGFAFMALNLIHDRRGQ
jgi:hypothetical protein